MSHLINFTTVVCILTPWRGAKPGRWVCVVDQWRGGVSSGDTIPTRGIQNLVWTIILEFKAEFSDGERGRVSLIMISSKWWDFVWCYVRVAAKPSQSRFVDGFNRTNFVAYEREFFRISLRELPSKACLQSDSWSPGWLPFTLSLRGLNTPSCPWFS